MSARHTPGPWKTNGRAIEQDKPKAALVIAYAEDEQNDDHKANARLIAAAPLMLATLRQMIDNCSCGEFASDPCANCERAQDAIDAAEGSR